MNRIQVTDDGMLVLDGCALPGVKMPPEEYPDEVYPDQIQDAMEYYNSYVRIVEGNGMKALTPQAYLMTILGKLGRTGAIREQMMKDWRDYYGVRNMVKMFGATGKDLEMFPTPRQEMMALLKKHGL